MSDRHASRQELARRGEDLAAAELERHGFQIVARNARAGRLEIDLVAQRGGLIVFCEVRARRTAAWGHPAETVDSRKQDRIRRAAIRWLSEQQRSFRQVRFDVVTCVLEDGAPAAIEHYVNAF